MHGGMQPPEKDRPGLPPPGVRPHPGWVPTGHRLHVVGLALGLDLSRGYDHAQFCIIRAFLYFLGLRIFGTLRFLRGMAHFHLLHYNSYKI